MSLEKYGNLVERLLRKTRDGSLEWKTSVQEGRYQISFKDNAVRIRAREDEENPMVFLELINDEGVVAETINDEELDSSIPRDKHFWYKEMATLYGLARRSALGSDKILDEILNDLDEDGAA